MWWGEDWFGLRCGEVLKVKRETAKFSRGKLVKYHFCTDSGRCFLVADAEDDLNREWLMDYDLERIKF